MQGAPQADTGSVHERTLRMAAEEQRRRWAFIDSRLSAEGEDFEKVEFGIEVEQLAA